MKNERNYKVGDIVVYCDSESTEYQILADKQDSGNDGVVLRKLSGTERINYHMTLKVMQEFHSWKLSEKNFETYEIY